MIEEVWLKLIDINHVSIKKINILKKVLDK